MKFQHIDRFYITKRVLAIAILTVGTAHILDLDFFEYLIRFFEAHEQWELDEVCLMLIMMIPAISADYCWNVWFRLERNNQTLALANAELQETAKMKDNFLAMMSHELRTPLNAVLGMAEAMQEEVFGMVTPEQITALQTIEHSGNHLLSLITDILDVAKIGAGKITLESMPLSLSSICQLCVSLVRQDALKKSIHLHTHVRPHLPKVWGDEQRVRQVILNLLSNAIKFTPQGGQVSLTVKLMEEFPNYPFSSNPANRVGLPFGPTQWLQLSVSDTGIGIASDYIDKLFEPFIQMDSALNRQYEGTGLGLTLAKEIVELHGGQISVTSEVGQGSCFTITLPCAPMEPGEDFSSLAALSHASDEGQRASHPLRSTPQSSNLRTAQTSAIPEALPMILLVEDNAANTKTLSSYLGSKGYRLLTATNGRDAVSIAQSEQPDVILMDIQMPEMDGLAAIQALRHSSQCAHTPIIALTALAMDSDRDRCLAAGANEYLSKPIPLKELVAVIHALTTASQED